MIHEGVYLQSGALPGGRKTPLTPAHIRDGRAHEASELRRSRRHHRSRVLRKERFPVSVTQYKFSQRGERVLRDATATLAKKPASPRHLRAAWKCKHGLRASFRPDGVPLHREHGGALPGDRDGGHRAAASEVGRAVPEGGVLPVPPGREHAGVAGARDGALASAALHEGRQHRLPGVGPARST